MAVFKLKPRKAGKRDSDQEALIKDVTAIIKGKAKDSAVRVIVLAAPMSSVVPFLAEAEKPSQELEDLEKKVEGLEIHEVTLLPTSTLEGRTMNIPKDDDSGK